MKAIVLIGAAICAATQAQAEFSFEVEVEVESENARAPLHSPTWLQINPNSKIAKLGYKEGSISKKGGLVFRTSSDAGTRGALECSAVGAAAAAATTGKFRARTIQCQKQQRQQDSSFRFKSTKEPTTLAQKLATPHGSYGGWLPFNSHLQLVPWPAPVAAYMMAYQGVYGCMIPVAGAHSMCPPDQLVGPFSLQVPIGQPLFLNPQDAPFIPANNAAAGGGD
jgi:hypothetical protein